MAATKIILQKSVRTIDANLVRGRSYEKIFTWNFMIWKSLHENFQIYGVCLQKVQECTLDINFMLT